MNNSTFAISLQFLINPLLDFGGTSYLENRAQVKKLFHKTIDPDSGEIINGTFAEFETNVTDVEYYYKGFAKCMEQFLKMNSSGQRVFAYVMQVYITTPMVKSYCDCIQLTKTGLNEINGQLLPFHMATFNRGMRELMEYHFLAKRARDQYWVNPNLIFRGSRSRYVQDYNTQVTALKGDPRFKQELEKDQYIESPLEPQVDVIPLQP